MGIINPPLLVKRVFLFSCHIILGIAFLLFMAANGPAIWGGCVTRRSIRAESWYFSREVVPVQGGYGALFAVMVQILLSITRVAVQTFSKPEIYHGIGFLL